jgi:hypothetical protein
MKSALFVDFDNVYTQLRALQPAAAERFARGPTEWIRWLVESLGVPDGHDAGARRRLLVRRCYLNPNWYQTYRHAFLRAGFEIVDCPPVTSQGKTSTDIHMVLDIVELLQHETRYDEFIVLSADADFTPVLRKLRRYDRRTSVLAIGFPSAAYQASADLLIDERLFVEQALGLAPEPVVREAPVIETAASVPTSPTLNLTEIAKLIEQVVAQSASPVSAALLASRLRQTYAPHLDQWNGHGKFLPFFRSLGLTRLVWLNRSGGRVADPVRHAADIAGEAIAESAETADVNVTPHEPPADVAPTADRVFDAGWEGHEDLLAIAREVSQRTGAPLLAPRAVRAVLESLSADLTQHGYDPSETAQRVRAACLERTPSIEVSQRDVVFTLRGMQLNGHAFGRGHDDAKTLAQRLCNQVLFLCQREEIVVDDTIRAQIRQWIGGDLLV